MSIMPGYEDGVYFNDEELDGIGWIVEDNLSHTYRSQGADFRCVDVQHGYNFDKNEYIISVTCQCVSHYDPEIFSRKEYGPYLDSVNGKDFTATRTFQYNRFDTHNTMGRSLAIDLTEDIENQIRAGVKKFNGGVTASRKIKASVDSEIAKYKKALTNKAAKSGIYENFGVKESRKLRERYSTYPDGDTDPRTAQKNEKSIREFERWCENFDLGYLRSIQNSTAVKASSKVVASNYDTKIIAKYLKKKFDDEAFGTSHSSSLGSFYRNNPNDPDIYMNRNGLFYNSRNNTITDKDDNPIFKVIPQYSHPKRQGVYPPKLPKIVPIDEWNATHNVEGCDKVTCSINSDYGEDMIKFFYKHQFLGACDPDYIECEALYDLMKSNKAVASQILEYMNHLGDPVFPVSEEDWGTPETNVDNVDLWELYTAFMQELDYEYDEDKSMGYDFCVYPDFQPWDLEIFEGEVAEDNVVTGSTEVTASGKATDSYKYYVAGFFDKTCRGIDDNLNTGDFDAIVDKAHDLASHGDYVLIKNMATGESQFYTPDEWMEAVELGGVPDAVYDLV